MRVSEMLQAIASWLESPDNEALLLSEYHDECLKVVAESCCQAANILKQASIQVEDLEPPSESLLTSEALQDLANIATQFDLSNDPELKKQASVIDELLLTIAAPPNLLDQKKKIKENRLRDLQKKYQDLKSVQVKHDKIADVKKAIEDSGMTKQFKILEAPLSSRYCPDHPGVQIARVGDHTWQCELDKKVYNFDEGFTLNDGSKVPGSSVEEQTKHLNGPIRSVFDDREGRLATNRP